MQQRLFCGWGGYVTISSDNHDESEINSNIIDLSAPKGVAGKIIHR